MSGDVGGLVHCGGVVVVLIVDLAVFVLRVRAALNCLGFVPLFSLVCLFCDIFVLCRFISLVTY